MFLNQNISQAAPYWLENINLVLGVIISLITIINLAIGWITKNKIEKALNRKDFIKNNQKIVKSLKSLKNKLMIQQHDYKEVLIEINTILFEILSWDFSRKEKTEIEICNDVVIRCMERDTPDRETLTDISIKLSSIVSIIKRKDMETL